MTDFNTLAITGANGYLGKHTIMAAISNGWRVIGIVRREKAAKDVESLGATPVIIKNFNVDILKKALTDCKAVIHFRGVVCGSRETFEEVNIEGIRTLINAAKEMKVSRIIFPSGLGVDLYGKAEWATNEYFRSKMEAEQILKKADVPYIIFRPSYILGPHDELIPELIEQIGDGTVLIAGKGDIPMQPISLNDAVDAFLTAAAGEGENNQIYDLVGPEITNMNELVNLVVDSMRNLGFNIPSPRLKYIPYTQAPDKLEICKEMIDVMRCDVISDGKTTASALGFKLSKLREAIKASVVAKMFPKEAKSEKKALILLSGGIDSATALYWAKKEGYDLLALTFNYHLRPEKEKKAALKLGHSIGIRVIEVAVEYLKEAIDLRIEGFPIPSVIDSPEGFIPTRNLVFYSIGAYYAEVYGCKYIIGGHISADTKKFPDADSSFFEALENLITMGKHSKDKTLIKFLLPLIELSKNDVIKLAKELNVPLKWTWSCYSDGVKPCGQCSCCLKRKEAFEAVGCADSEFSL